MSKKVKKMKPALPPMGERSYASGALPHEVECEVKSIGIDSLEGGQGEVVPACIESNFGWALDMLRAGKGVYRAGWNAITLDDEPQDKPRLLLRLKGKERLVMPHIIMEFRTGECVPWLASQTDMLATDWKVL